MFYYLCGNLRQKGRKRLEIKYKCLKNKKILNVNVLKSENQGFQHGFLGSDTYFHEMLAQGGGKAPLLEAQQPIRVL